MIVASSRPNPFQSRHVKVLEVVFISAGVIVGVLFLIFLVAFFCCRYQPWLPLVLLWKHHVEHSRNAKKISTEKTPRKASSNTSPKTGKSQAPEVTEDTPTLTKIQGHGITSGKRTVYQSTTTTMTRITTSQHTGVLNTFLRPTPVQPNIYMREPPLNWSPDSPMASMTIERPQQRAFSEQIGISQRMQESRLSSSIPAIQVDSLQEVNTGASFLSKGENASLGELHFSLTYNVKIKTLFVTIVEAQKLPVMDATDSTNAYVRLLLQSASSQESGGSTPATPQKVLRHPPLSTRISRSTVTPQWNEIFAINNLPPESLQQNILRLEIRDSSQRAATQLQVPDVSSMSSASSGVAESEDEDPLIGVVTVSLVPLYDPQAPEKYFDLWRYVQPHRVTRHHHHGEVLVGLSYKYKTSSLSIQLLEARHLHAREDFLVENMLCSVQLQSNTHKILSKTNTFKATAHKQSLWGRTLKLKHIPRKELSEKCSLIIQLFVLTAQHDKIPGLLLGEVRIVAHRFPQWGQLIGAGDRQLITNWFPMHSALHQHRSPTPSRVVMDSRQHNQ